MMSLTVLLCDVYPDVLCSIDSIETKMVIIDVFFPVSCFYPLL